jgi:hypothetical protein
MLKFKERFTEENENLTSEMLMLLRGSSGVELILSGAHVLGASSKSSSLLLECYYFSN